MPDISRRSLAAGAGLLVGAMALKASAQQQIATRRHDAQVPRPAAHLQSRQDQMAVGKTADQSSRQQLCRRGEAA